MRINDYLSVLMIQLNMTLDCNSSDEYLIETDSMEEQFKKAFEMMQSKQPDITLPPEMAYVSRFEKTYQELSKPNKIIGAGSYYKDGINRTVVFQNGEKRAQCVYGEFIVPEILSRFGRSDSYMNNPRNVVVSSL